MTASPHPLDISTGAIIEHSVKALIETLESMLGEHFKPTGAEELPSGEDLIAATLSFSYEGGGWHLGLLASHEHGQLLTREVFALDSDEEVLDDDLADALGEVINILAGFVKESFDREGLAVQFGLPIFVEGSNWLKQLSRKTETQVHWVDDGTQRFGMAACWQHQ